MDDDITCGDDDCSACCLIFDGCGECGACCEGCSSCGDGCCLFLGDSLGCCDPTPPALATAPDVHSNTAALPSGPSVIDSQPVNTAMLPTFYPTGPALYNDVNERRNVKEHRDGDSKYTRHGKCSSCPSLRTVLPWLLVLVVIAALGVTLWLTRNIRFGTNCGNAHRALIGVLFVIIGGGIAMPLYYKYVQLDLIKKDLRQQHQALLDATTPFDSSIIKRNRKPKTSVLASKRFSLALKVTTFILILVVALGYYYLWSKENRCLDPNLWIVKGWFIALLVVAVVVTALMFAAMYRAVKERRLLNTARYEADEDDVPNSQVINMDPREATPSQEPLSPTNPPPVYPGSPLSKDAPPGQMQTQTSSKPDQHELAQIEETIAEQLGQQQQQQQSHQQQMGQSQAGYGASGTGAYC